MKSSIGHATAAIVLVTLTHLAASLPLNDSEPTQLIVKVGHDPPTAIVHNVTDRLYQTENSREATGESGRKVAPNAHAIALWGWRWKEVSSYFITTAFLVVAAVVKILYHHSFIHNHVPESCVLILFGTLFELVIYLSGVQEHVPSFSSDLFFFLLLPPIILESAYSLHDRVFFSNLGTVLLYAIVGTLMNVFLIGPSLWLVGLTGAYGKNTTISFLETLTFSTLISAVDPVAVLGIFQEIGVNKALYFLVFGESLLNDAVVIVLYNSVTAFSASETIELVDVLFGVLNFFTVSGGGLFIGIIIGALTALITRFTDDVRVVEPLVVIAMAYLSYVSAELFHFSGIISLIGCGLMQIEYSKHNISSRSYVTTKYFTRNLSSISDVIIFFFLGKVLVRETHVWNTSFVLLATFFCVVYRFASVFSLTFFANYFFKRIRFINFEEQLVMAYGGLRGAIAFSLAIMLNREHIKNADLFITSTLFVILFTVFVLGSTTKTVVRLLRVKTEDKSDPKMFIFVSNKLMETYMAGLEEIAGQKSSNHWFAKLSRFNDEHIKSVLIKGGANAANGYTELYEKVKNRRPRSTVFAVTGAIALSGHVNSTKNVRFTNGTAVDPEVIQVTEESPSHAPEELPPGRWRGVKNAFDFARKASVEQDRDDRVGRIGPSSTRHVSISEARDNNNRRPSVRSARRPSLFSLRRNSEEEEGEQARQALNSALSRTAFFQLPGSLNDHDHDLRHRQNVSRYRTASESVPLRQNSREREAETEIVRASQRRSQPFQPPLRGSNVQNRNSWQDRK